MFCEQCGAEVEQDARFCAMCGKGVVGEGHTSALRSAILRKALPAIALGAAVVLGGILLWISMPERSDFGEDAQSTRANAFMGDNGKKESVRDIDGGTPGGNDAVGSSKELTRDMAARMITEHEGYPKAVEGRIPRKSFYQYREGLANPNRYKELEQRGLIQMQQTCKGISSRTIQCDFVVELTNEGRKYFIRWEDNDIVIKACELKLVGVTGISPMQFGFTGAEVEYNVTYDNPTPFSSVPRRSYEGADCENSRGKTYQRSSNFRLYDDGWRLG